MPTRSVPSLFRGGSALALVLVLAACTNGGQFDPTEVFNNDMFDSKKKISGDRQPLFPNGVPGTTTGVPPDLVKGYQPPPEQADATAAPAPAAKAERPKPPPKPKPILAATPTQQQQPQKQDPVWNQPPVAAAAPVPKRISVGPGSQQSSGSARQQAEPSQSSAQSPWPAPPQPAAASQAPWPIPPAPARSSQ